MGSLSFSLQGGVDHGLPAPLNGAGSPDPSDNQWRRGPERKMRAVHQMKQSPFLAGVPAPRARSCCSLTLLHQSTLANLLLLNRSHLIGSSRCWPVLEM